MGEERPVRGGERLIVLDALRGVAALIVMLHHARTLFSGLGVELAASSPALDAALAAIARRNTEAVLTFFVLSGFSIGLSVQRRGLHAQGALRDYALRRARRIVPLYWLALGLAAAVALTLAPVAPDAIGARTLLGNLLFLQTAVGVPGAWFVPYAGNGALWSLSFEVFFYAVYPLLVLGVPSMARRSAIVLAISALGYAVGARWPSPPAMFCSALLIWYFGVELAQRYVQGAFALPAAVYAALWVLLAMLRATASGVTFHGALVGCTLLGLGALWIAWAQRRGADARAASGGRVRVEAARSSGWLLGLAAVGEISYGLYALHVPVLRGFAAGVGTSAAAACAAMGASLCVAYVAERATRALLARGGGGAV